MSGLLKKATVPLIGYYLQLGQAYERYFRNSESRQIIFITPFVPSLLLKIKRSSISVFR